MEKIVSERTIRRRAVANAASIVAATEADSEDELDHNNQPNPIQDDAYDVGSDSSTDSEPNIIDQYGQDDEQLPFNSDMSDASADEDSTGSDQENIDAPDIRDSLRQWVLDSNTPLSHANTLLAILKPHFPSLPNDSRTLLKTICTYNIEELSGGQFYYFGVREGLKSKLQKEPNLTTCDELTLQFNIDGLPLFKSTSDCFWPILALVKEANPLPFIIALWLGKSKPRDSNELLEKFVAEMKDIEENGLVFNEKIYSVKIVNFVCDTPARAFVKKTKGHCGYDGCDFCVQHGVYFMHRMTFPEVEAHERTDIGFDRMMYEDSHQNAESILRQLNIGLVSQFPHDYMHLVCLGVVKKLISLWMNGPLNVRVGNNVIKSISDSILNLKNHLPREFTRKGRPLIEVDRWKATEFRTFLLYVGPVVLRGKLSDALYDNFLMLFVGITILSNGKFCHDYCEYVKDLLNVWVQNVSDLYGRQAVIYNVHGITHLASQCRLYGPLHNFCGFPFENFLQTIKKLVRKPNSPLQQVIRRLNERKDTSKLPKETATFCKRKHHCGPLPDDVGICDQYEQLQSPDYLLSSKSPDNAVLAGQKPYIIRNIVVQNNLRKLVCQKFSRQEHFFEYPIDSRSLDIAFVSNLGQNLTLVDLNDVAAKIVLLPYDDGFVSIPMHQSI